MDTADAIYQWNGSEASAHEKAKAAELCVLLQQDGAAQKFREVRVLDEGTPEGDGVAREFKYKSNHGFWRHLPGERRFLGLKFASITVKDAAKGGDDDRVQAFEPVLFYVSSSGGEPHFRCAWRGKLPPVSRLKSERVCLFDNGFQCFIWAGKKAPRQDRASSFVGAQNYLKRWKRPSVLPITRFNEGMESEAFRAAFGPPEPPACCGGCAVS
jgi:gelsolin